MGTWREFLREGMYEWARGWYVWGGWAAAMPWVDLTSVTLMAFVFAATLKEEQMSPSPLHTPLTAARPLTHTHLGFYNKIKVWTLKCMRAQAYTRHAHTQNSNLLSQSAAGPSIQPFKWSLGVGWPLKLYVISLAELRQCNE